jgi:dTDP-4-amino-4,6-dideoxygalactose transaminase
MAPKPVSPELATQYGDSMISDVDARLTLSQLRKLSEIIGKRRQHAIDLRGALESRGDLVSQQSDRDHVYTKLTLTFEHRSVAGRFSEHMAEQGIEVEAMYVPLHLREFAAAHATRPLPTTETLLGRVLNVPIRPNLSAIEVSRIARAIEAFRG